MKPGDTLGQYRIEERLGVGGMGEVYLAVDTKLNRPVALKTLRREFFLDPDRHRRFIQEARAASALDHPNIVTIYDIAEEDGLHFIVMQYVAGESLGDLIRAASAKASAFAGATADKSASQGLDLEKALDYAIQMADGLARAHRDGIVHRDLKPDNVMVSEEGRAKIVDFGLAKLTEPTEPTGEAPTVAKGGPLTREGEILGTGAYMSPEQALGKEIDARSDIFSFGSVLYEMVTGGQAFTGESIASVLAAIMRDEPERVSQLVPTVPAGLEEVIERALRKDREQRFQSMEELRQALIDVKEGGTRKPAHSQIVQIGDFEVDLEAGELSKHGRKIKLQGKPFEILALLLERPGRVVSRQELFKRLWPSDTFVDFDNSVNAAINKLRAALGDSSDKPRYIETVPRRGYRFIGSVQFADGSSSGAIEPASVLPDVKEAVKDRAAGRRKYGAWITAAAFIGLLVIAVVPYLREEGRPTPTPRIRPLTTYEGAEFEVAFSPDGNQVVFAWTGRKMGDALHLYVRLIDGTEPLQLTHGHGVVNFNPAWSPDGRQIAFLRGGSWEGARSEIFVVSALGGDERRLGSTNSGQHTKHKLSWSPDGKFLAIVDKVSPQSPRSPEAIFLLSLETGERRQLTWPTGEIDDSNPTFSPDGQSLAFIRSKEYAWVCDVYRVPVAGGEETRLTFDETEIWGLDWTSDGQELIYSSIEIHSGRTGLWHVSRDGGEPEKFTFGEGANFVTVARRGNRLAYSRHSINVNLWRVGGPTSERPPSPERFVASTAWDFGPRYSPDGSRLAFVTARSGLEEIWICDATAEDCARLAPGGRPVWSPDGDRVAFWGFGSGAREGGDDIPAPVPAVHLVEAEGGFAHLLADEDGYPTSWSRDGRFLYFAERTGRGEIWKISVKGGEPQQVTRNGGVAAFESEDGRFLYFARHGYPRTNKIWKMDVEGGEETLVLDKEPDYQGWALWRNNIVYLNPEGATGPTIELLDLDTEEIRELVSLPNRIKFGPFGNALTVSPDGRWIVYEQVDELGSDLMLVENFR